MLPHSIAQRRKPLPSVLFAFVALLLVAGGAAAVEVPGLDDARPAAAARVVSSLSERFSLHPAAVPEHRLDPLELDALLREDAQRVPGFPKALRIGVGRKVALEESDGEWLPVPGGRVWIADLTSPGAKGLRLHMGGVDLPPGAELDLHPAPDGHPVLRQRRGDVEGDAWSGTVFGERARIEYFSPAGAPPGLPFAIDTVQHLYRNPLAPEAPLSEEESAGPCHNDVTCYAEWKDLARASARVDFVHGNFAYSCSGQLLNDQRQDWTPYFLTAYHCVHDVATAQSAEFHWLYQTPTCNGTPPDPNQVPRSLHATLLVASFSTDVTLLMVEGSLPTGLYWAGWTSDPIADGTDAACIHHPSGDYTRISFGNKNGFAGCQNSNWVRINWTNGPTEGGSSGGGVFTDDGEFLFGTLTDGPSRCGSETYDCFGAFAAAYPSLRGFLAGGSDDGSEPNDSCGQARTVGRGRVKHRVARLFDADWYQASVPAGSTLTVTIRFTGTNGGLDLSLLGACGTPTLAFATGGVNQERVQVTNRGSSPLTYHWQVSLAGDVRNTYDLTVGIN